MVSRREKARGFLIIDLVLDRMNDHSETIGRFIDAVLVLAKAEWLETVTPLISPAAFAQLMVLVRGDFSPYPCLFFCVARRGLAEVALEALAEILGVGEAHHVGDF